MKKEERKKLKLSVLQRSLRICAMVLFFLLSVTIAHAQNASREMETLLKIESVTYAQAARFVLEAADIAAFENPLEAFNYAHEKNWLPKNANVNTQAKLDGVSLLIMRSFDLKGGMMYSLTKSARYAYREMLYKNLIQGKADPAMKVSGEDLLFITGRILSMNNEQ